MASAGMSFKTDKRHVYIGKNMILKQSNYDKNQKV